MKKITIFILLIILISIFFIFIYLNKPIKKNITKIDSTENKERSYSSNIIENVKYTSRDSNGNEYTIKRYDFDLKKSIKQVNKETKIIIGHSRLVTNSMSDNQPLFKNGISLLHNGIVTNYKNLFKKYKLNQELKIDTEIILELINYFLNKNKDLETAIYLTLKEIKGSASCVVHLLNRGKLILFTNNGSLYTGQKNHDIYISS